MSKIDELIPIAERLRKDLDALTQFIQKYEPSGLKAETPEPKQTANWVPKPPTEKGPWELLNDMNSAEYRELRQELGRSDHTLYHMFNGQRYSIWLLNNGSIGRRMKP